MLLESNQKSMKLTNVTSKPVFNSLIAGYSSLKTGFYQLDSIRNLTHSPLINLSGRWAHSGLLPTALGMAKFGSLHTYSSNVFSKEDLMHLTAP